MFISLNSAKQLLYLSRVAILIVASSIYGVSQVPTLHVYKARPELTLRIVPGKETYSLHERVVAKAEVTNLTDKTLCFPVPGQRGEYVASGYIAFEGTPVSGASERDRFIDHFDGGSGDNLIDEIEKRWIKLAPNATYIVNVSDALVDSDVIGAWRLKGTYHPPQCSFNVVICNEHLRSTAKKTGCRVPENYVSAVPVAVNVVPEPEQKSSLE